MKIQIRRIRIDYSDSSRKRFRKDFGNLQEMISSLKRHGLIHPIVVDEVKDDPEHDYVLVVGGRRLAAALYLGWTEIEAVVRASLTDIQRKEIELEENVQRKDLSWMEEIEALRQLDELKRAIHGSKAQGSIDEKGWTIRDTAEVVRESLGTVSQDLSLAKALASDPLLRKKVDGMPKLAARKFVEREMAARRMKAKILAGAVTISADLILGRAEEEIKKIADGSIDCLITDPPFAIEEIHVVEQGGLSSGRYAGEANVGDPEAMKKVYEELIPQLSRVMVGGAHFYMFFGIQWYEYLKALFQKNAFIVHPLPLFWFKGRGSMIPNPYHYIPSYETILFGCKAPQSRTLLKPRHNSLIEFPADAPQTRIHPLQKPRSLIEMMIENSTVPGEMILDCFVGSAIVLKTAKEMGRRSIGFETNEQNYLKAQEFLANGKRQDK